MDLVPESRLIGEVMNESPELVGIDAELRDIIKIFTEKEVDAVLVTVEGNKLTGIITEKDIVAVVPAGIDLSTKAETLMTGSPVAVGPETTIDDCSQLLVDKGFRHMPVTIGDKVVGLVNILDLQAGMLVESQERFEGLQDLRNAIAKKDEFIGILAHDIRSPLALIASCTQLLRMLDKDKKELTETHLNFIERIDKGQTRALQLVTDILDMGRINHGLKLEYQQLYIPDYLGGIMSDLSQLAADKEIEIVSRIDAPIQASFDPNRVEQIIDNLVGNAIKITPVGKKVFVESRVGYCEGLNREGLFISITDEGPGIPDDMLKSVFEKFAQLDNAAQHLGVGLGLTIVRQFVAMHEGEVSVESDEGLGAKFTVFLPNASEVISLEEVAEMEAMPLILLVDDDEDIREFFAETLEDQGFKVVHAENGQQGLDLAQRLKPKLILTDIQMPVMDGIEMLSIIRQRKLKSAVVLISGCNEDLTEELAQKHLKADGFLEKPFKDIDILRLVKQHICL